MASFPGQKAAGPPLPNQVLGLTATAVSPTQVNLSWTLVTNAVTYTVLRNGAFFSSQTATTLTDTTATANTSYVYAVNAVNANGVGRSSSVTVVTPPAQVVGLVATPVSTTQINLTWTAQTGVTYAVFRNGTQVGTPSAASFPDTGLTAATSYTYTVKAVGLGGSGAASSPVSATTQGSSGGAVNWHPGWYLASNGYQTSQTAISAEVQSDINALFASNTHYASIGSSFRNPGYRMFLKWGAAEVNQGIYLWRLPNNPINAVLAQLVANNTTLVVTIDPSEFGAWGPGHVDVIPAYIQNNSANGNSPQTGYYGFWGDWPSLNGTPGPFYVAALWRPAVAAHFAAMWADFANWAQNSQYSANIEALMMVESSVFPQGATDYPVTDGTYSNNNLQAALQQILLAGVNNGPKINYIMQNTFWFGSGCGVLQAQQFEQWMIQNRIAPSSPDTIGHTTILAEGAIYGWGLAAYRGEGLTQAGCTTYTGPDYAVNHQSRAMMDIQAPDQGYYGGVHGHPGGWTTQDIATALVNDYKASHAFFTYQTGALYTTSITATGSITGTSLSTGTRASFTGSISGNILTTSATLKALYFVSGTGVAQNTYVTAVNTDGTYTLSLPNQTVSSRTLISTNSVMRIGYCFTGSGVASGTQITGQNADGTFSLNISQTVGNETLTVTSQVSALWANAMPIMMANPLDPTYPTTYPT